MTLSLNNYEAQEKRRARVTREIASRLAQLARSLEGEHAPEEVANFLMRCLFTMFAEDVELLPERSFTQLLTDIVPEHFKPMIEHLWQTMNTGGFSVILRTEIPHFDGGLFADPIALPLNADQIQLLVEAARSDWRDVEPAIFGTLLERALDPVERHKLGAHYTPRAYVERLVQPTIIEPLRAEWEGVQTAAALLADEGKTGQALAEIENFQRRLATVKILDPACGSGNFLYVTLEHLKRLEGEVLNTRSELGQSQTMLEIESVMVTPQQFLGIEVNPRAAAITELVLWIGYLQWHFRTRGQTLPPSPIIRNYHNIECRDAVLDWDSVEPLLDDEGNPVTHWDGRTTKPHHVTGEEVPDETVRIPAYNYLNSRPAEWPKADFVVGNPPFIGNKRMRLALGDGYVDALRRSHKNIPATSDYVMYWWDHSALLIGKDRIARFGLVTTNSITQAFNRKVLNAHLKAKDPVSIDFAIPDHPWVDTIDGAAVRISMTVASKGHHAGVLKTIVHENVSEVEERKVVLTNQSGKIYSDLRIGPDVSGVVPLKANKNMSFQGVIPLGKGFRLSREQLEMYGFDPSRLPEVIKSYIIGRDIVQKSEEKYVIDFFGFSEQEAKQKNPTLFQHLLIHVKPERDQNRRETRRKNWWLFGENAPKLRSALRSLDRFIIVPDTSKYKPFVFVDGSILPDVQVYSIIADDGWILGVLQSKVHQSWLNQIAPRMGKGNDLRWKPAIVFDPFPFPAPTDVLKTKIRDLAEQLDAHRKRQQARHPRLTMTNMYNVLEKLRAGESLTKKEQETHEQGLVSILKQLHDDLDAAVFEAYSWPANLSDEEILEHLVALNAERATEEAKGHIRWLRPEYQAPEEAPTSPIVAAEKLEKIKKSIQKVKEFPIKSKKTPCKPSVYRLNTYII